MKCAAIWRDLAICQYLLEHEADPDRAIHCLMHGGVITQDPAYSTRAVVGIARLLVNDYDVEFEPTMLISFIGDTKTFFALMETLDRPYYEGSMEGASLLHTAARIIGIYAATATHPILRGIVDLQQVTGWRSIHLA